MNKSEFVSAIANANNVTQNDAAQFVNSFIEIVGDTLSQGEDVALPGFGTFSTSVRAARTGRNPQTGDVIQIAEATLPKFKAGKGLKDKIKAK